MLRARASSVVKVHPLTRKAILQQLCGQFNRGRAAPAGLFLFLNAEKTLKQNRRCSPGFYCSPESTFFDSLIILQDKMYLLHEKLALTAPRRCPVNITLSVEAGPVGYGSPRWPMALLLIL